MNQRKTKNRMRENNISISKLLQAAVSELSILSWTNVLVKLTAHITIISNKVI